MKKRHTPEQIVRKLRQAADAQLAEGASIPEVAKRLGVSAKRPSIAGGISTAA